MKPEDIIKRPIVLTEKATRSKQDNKFVFQVALDANKIEIRQAVEALFKVRVTDVSTLVQRGKAKRAGRRVLMRPNWKKAVVTLKPGDEIQFFAQTEE